MTISDSPSQDNFTSSATLRPDRRAHPRWLPARETRARLAAPSIKLKLWVRVIDISRRGICLLMNRRLPDGTLFTLQLQNSNNNQPCTLRCRVIHVEELEPGSFVTGSVLEDELNGPDLDLLLS
jgi:hypothetical protein